MAGLSAQPPCFWNVSTLAGSGAAGWADGQGTAAVFNMPVGVFVDPSSQNVLVGDFGGHRLRSVTPSGLVTTIAGSGNGAFANGEGTAASFFFLHGAQADSIGNMYVADCGNNRIRKVLPSGSVSTLAGSGASGGSNGIGTAAQFRGPTDIALDSYGFGYIVEQEGHRIRRIDLSTATVSLLAGSGVSGFADGVGSAAQFGRSTSAVWHPSGVLYVADGMTNNRIRCVVTASGSVST
jgi:hypothetical protein